MAMEAALRQTKGMVPKTRWTRTAPRTERVMAASRLARANDADDRAEPCTCEGATALLAPCVTCQRFLIVVFSAGEPTARISAHVGHLVDERAVGNIDEEVDGD